MNDQKKLKKMIETYSFVLYETALYLDTHPDCRPALRYFAKYREKLTDAVRLYEEEYGPVTMYGNKSVDSWNWVEQPWPWEL